ncbi:MAG: P1 family peptidase [Tissierellia bacterium]|nr:P1 family peptidase [Tissierellia bacterium]
MNFDLNSLITGTLDKGSKNLITDVDGVLVGHSTISLGEIQTGVTVLLPHGGDIFHQKYLAASHVINGFGKSIGLIQVDELGTIETPIVLTNTLSIGTAVDAIIKYMLKNNLDIADKTGTVNPLVLECNDGKINNIREQKIEHKHIYEAINNAKSHFMQGAIGAGRGMRCHGIKGGIGSSSRRFKIFKKDYTIGSLVLSNHGRFEDLIINGQKVSDVFKDPNTFEAEKEKGSIIVILATDAPLTERQIKRVCKRAVAGLSRTGSFIGNGSGEIVLAFSTAHKINHYQKELDSIKFLPDNELDIIFKATAETVHESVLNSLFYAETVTGKDNYRCVCLNDLIKK